MITKCICGGIFRSNSYNLNPIPAILNITLAGYCEIRFELEATCTENVLSELFVRRPDGSFAVEFYQEVRIPVRRCKKKRIQKKWINKYGTKVAYLNKRHLFATEMSVTKQNEFMQNSPFLHVTFSGSFYL